MYLETLKVPGAEQYRGVYPRIKVYTANHLNMLVEADKSTSSSSSRKVSWGSTIVSAELLIIASFSSCILYLLTRILNFHTGP
jgi:hypothetical protein